MSLDVKEHRDALTNEYYLSFTHKSGVYVMISPNTYSSSCAVYSSDYGGGNVSFEYGGRKYDTPAGVAHFLEHKLFETEDGGDAFSLFGALGADSNAFTSHQSTSYTFTSQNDAFYDSLKILLHFVHDPHFTKESVEKERGIIAEEIKMYDDSPDNRCYYELMKCLYKNNRIRYDVGGTVDSIAGITPELLYLCHKAFYSPSSMTLVISGDATPEKVAAIMDEQIPPCDPAPVKKLYPREPDKVNRRLSRLRMEVSEPLFGFGIKDAPEKDKLLSRRKCVALSILSDMLFGTISAFYCGCYEKGLLSGDVDAGYYCGEDHAYLSVFGESRKPFTVKKLIYETLDRTLESGIDAESFEISKKIFYADFIYSLQSSQSVAYSLLSFHQSGDDMAEYTLLLSGIDADFAFECLKSIYKKDRCSFAITEPADGSRREKDV